MSPKDIDYTTLPDNKGHFGQFGGRFIAETLMQPIDELTAAYEKLKNDPAFQKEFDDDLAHYVGRPSPLYLAERLTEKYGCKNLSETRRPQPYRRT